MDLNILTGFIRALIFSILFTILISELSLQGFVLTYQQEKHDAGHFQRRNAVLDYKHNKKLAPIWLLAFSPRRGNQIRIHPFFCHGSGSTAAQMYHVPEFTVGAL